MKTHMVEHYVDGSFDDKKFDEKRSMGHPSSVVKKQLKRDKKESQKVYIILTCILAFLVYSCIQDTIQLRALKKSISESKRTFFGFTKDDRFTSLCFSKEVFEQYGEEVCRDAVADSFIEMTLQEIQYNTEEFESKLAEMLEIHLEMMPKNFNYPAQSTRE